MRRLLIACTVGAALSVLNSAASYAQFPRIVLIEEFTSATCTPCVEATPVMNRVMGEMGDRAVALRYHCNIPAPGDPWFTSMSATRMSHYGVQSLPAAWVDGSWSVFPKNEADLRDRATIQKNTTAPVKITVEKSKLDGDQYRIVVRVKAGPDGMPQGAYWLRVAVAEAHIHVDELKIPSYNHEKDFYDVVRTMLPDAKGTSLTVLAPDEEGVFTFFYTPPSGGNWVEDQLYAVAFIQDDFSPYDVVQAGFSQRPAVAGVSRLTDVKSGYALMESAPNPASGSATIGYTLGASERVMITLHNANGDRVLSSDQGMQESGAHHATVDLSTLPAGVYSYTVTAGSWTSTKMLTVVR